MYLVELLGYIVTWCLIFEVLLNFFKVMVPFAFFITGFFDLVFVFQGSAMF